MLFMVLPCGIGVQTEVFNMIGFTLYWGEVAPGTSLTFSFLPVLLGAHASMSPLHQYTLCLFLEGERGETTQHSSTTHGVSAMQVLEPGSSSMVKCVLYLLISFTCLPEIYYWQRGDNENQSMQCKYRTLATELPPWAPWLLRFQIRGKTTTLLQSP